MFEKFFDPLGSLVLGFFFEFFFSFLFSNKTLQGPSQRRVMQGEGVTLKYRIENPWYRVGNADKVGEANPPFFHHSFSQTGGDGVRGREASDCQGGL